MNAEIKSVCMRLFYTVMIVVLAAFVNQLFSQVMTIFYSKSAVDQLSSSDGSFFKYGLIIAIYHYMIIAIPFLTGASILYIWRMYILKIITTVIAPVLLIACLNVPEANAYYDQKDRGEYVEVNANQSAFLIPMNGDNKSAQGKFGSVDYLDANKIAIKRVQIPHVKADNTSLFSDYYIPGAKLYLLDRTPVHREWVSHDTRGTSTKDEGFRFESAESINISTGITITAYVKEEDAAKFFYWFGAAAQQNSTDPQIMYASVVYGRSLADVVDKVVRAQVQATLAREFGKRPLDKGISEKAIIIDAVMKDIQDQFSPKGITVATLGYAEALSLDPLIQSMINDNYIASKKLLFADAYNTTLNIQMREADIKLREAEGKAIQKWDGKINLPNFMVVSDSIANMFGGVFNKTEKVQAK